MRYGSVCSGIEAATCAWHPLGWKPAWFAEIEAFPSAVLSHHYPDVANLGDMTAIAERIRDGITEAPDILVGGTPCQAFSIAGLRASLEDSRGQLSLAFCRLADAIDAARHARGEQPAIVVWENVPGVLNTKDNAFGCFLAGLAGEDDALTPPGERWANAGVVFGPSRTVAWRVLDAQYFGVAQRRRRVFVVASAREGLDPGAVLLEFDGVRRDSPPSREAGEGATHPVAPCVDASGCGFARTGDIRGQDPVVAVYGGNRTSGECPVAPALNAKGGSGRMDFETEALCVTGDRTHALRAEGADASEDGTGRGTPISAFHHNAQACQLPTAERDTSISDALTCSQQAAVAIPFDTTQITSKANYSRPQPGDPCRPLAAGAHPPAIAFSCKDHGADAGEIAPTMRSMGHDGSHPNGGGQLAVQFAAQVRRLTPTECERLQGFPDDYTLIPWRKKPAALCPDGPRYKALGNSMAVPVMRWIGRRIAGAV